MGTVANSNLVSDTIESREGVTLRQFGLDEVKYLTLAAG